MYNFIKSLDSFTFEPFQSTDIESYPILPPGVYDYSTESVGIFKTITLLRKKRELNKLISFDKDPIIEDITQELLTFFSPRVVDVYNRMGINHQTAYVFYGPPGTGKTCLVNTLMKRVAAEHGVISFEISCGDGINEALSVIEQIRKRQDNPIIVFIDEFDVFVRRQEVSMLTVMDGVNSVPGLAILGCTNNLDNIPERFKNRKSRIKRCIEISQLSAGVYDTYIKETASWISPSLQAEMAYKGHEQKLTIDQFKHFILDYLITPEEKRNMESNLVTISSSEEE